MKNHLRYRHSIELILESINTVLTRASHTLRDAHAAILRDEQNLAIGTALGAEQDVDTALILYRSALALHRLDKEATCK